MSTQPVPNGPFKIFYFQVYPLKGRIGNDEMMLWLQHSMQLTGARIVSLLHKSFNGDRRWSSSHSARPRRLTSGVTASLERQPKQKGVQPAPIAEAIQVTQACARAALSSYSIYRISILNTGIKDRQTGWESQYVCERNRNDPYGPQYVCIIYRRVWDDPGELCSGGLQVAQRVR